jgi:integrase
VEPPPVESDEIEILTADEVGAVLKAFRGRALYPLVSLALATGMRRGEILGLRWKDIDLDALNKVRAE